MLYYLLFHTFKFLLRIIYFLTGGIVVEGQENLPHTGGVLITPNHISDADPYTVSYALPRYCYTMAKSELFEVPVLGTLIRLLHGFPVKRYTADRTALRTAENYLKQGSAVVIFPEGQVSEFGNLLPMLPGALLVARRANVPIVPVAIVHTNLLVPYKAVLPRRIGKPIRVIIGRPVQFSELSGGLSGSAAVEAAAQSLHGILLQMTGQHAQNSVISSAASEPE